MPLVTSKGVMNALCAGEVDYGVMATRNSVAGPVLETGDAVAGISYRVLAEDQIHIHHCLFVKDASITHFDTIASHIQALRQCSSHLADDYPDAKWRELEDTAIGARYLHDGTLPPTTGILCRKHAGEAFGLYLLRENFEDNPNNITEFMLVELQHD